MRIKLILISILLLLVISKSQRSKNGVWEVRYGPPGQVQEIYRYHSPHNRFREVKMIRISKHSYPNKSERGKRTIQKMLKELKRMRKERLHPIFDSMPPPIFPPFFPPIMMPFSVGRMLDGFFPFGSFGDELSPFDFNPFPFPPFAPGPVILPPQQNGIERRAIISPAKSIIEELENPIKKPKIIDSSPKIIIDNHMSDKMNPANLIPPPIQSLIESNLEDDEKFAFRRRSKLSSPIKSLIDLELHPNFPFPPLSSYIFNNPKKRSAILPLIQLFAPIRRYMMKVRDMIDNDRSNTHHPFHRVFSYRKHFILKKRIPLPFSDDYMPSRRRRDDEKDDDFDNKNNNDPFRSGFDYFYKNYPGGLDTPSNDKNKPKIKKKLYV